MTTMSSTSRLRAGLAFGLALVLSAPGVAQEPAAHRQSQLAALQTALDSLWAESGAPGVSVGVSLAGGEIVALAAGSADTTTGEPLATDGLLLQGSVGKTYVAAVAMQLVAEGLLDLEAPVARYLGREAWFDSVPNHDAVTVRHLMTHTSGIVRYEFNPRFIEDLLADPDRVWRPEEQIAYLFGSEPPFAAGEGWDYSDTNYLLLGLVIEELTGNSYYEELRRRILDPLALEQTVPSDSRRIPGLVQGYPGRENGFGLPEAVLEDGVFAINPQFEWTGGGIASTAGDLARWARLLYEGEAFDPSLLPVMLDGVPARLGPDVQYGLGVIIRPTPLGPSWGHSGFFPGYLAEVAYFPDHRIAVAVQMNSSDFRALGISPLRMLLELSRVVVRKGGG